MTERSPRDRGGQRRPVRVAGQRARERAREDRDEIAEQPSDAGRDATETPEVTAPAQVEPEDGDTPAVGDEDPGLPNTSPTSRRPRRRWAVAVVAVLAVLAVLLGVADGLTLYFGRQHGAVHAARGEALNAAKHAAASINSYSYKHFDSDTKAAAKHFTGHFRKNYQQLIHRIRPTVKKYHAVVLASPNGVAAREVTPDQAIVLVSLNQITTSTKLDHPRLDRYRMRLTMVKRGGKWLVNNETAL
jgi:Mce-associated membrane protein